MHEAGIVADDQFGASHQIGRFVQVELAAGIVYFKRIDGRQLFPRFRIFLSAQDNHRVIIDVQKCLQFMQADIFLCCARHQLPVQYNLPGAK